MRVETVDDGRGRREAVKEAETVEEAARLCREADLLDVAAHPGLIEVIAFDDGPQPVLRTAYVGEPLAGAGALELEETAGVVAAVATTLADLHGLGLVHGAVDASHVLLDGDGRPVLCGLGYGGLAGERPASAVHPALAGDTADVAALNPAGDVRNLGALLASLLAGADGTVKGGAADELRRIVDRATAPSIPDRPTARQVADAVHDAVPGARLPRRGGAGTAPRPRPDLLAARQRRRPLERWRHAQRPAAVSDARRGRVVVGLVAAVAVAAASVVWLQSTPSTPTPEASLSPEPAAPVREPVAEPGTTVEGTTTTLAAVTREAPRRAREGCPEVDGPMTADVDGDGCAEAVRYAAGVVEAAGRRWAAGEAGDVAAVGDWYCSGTRSLALLRPLTGEVFTFSGWATAGNDLAAPLAAQVTGGRSLRVADIDADGCNELVVERTSGAPAVVRAKRGTP